MFLVVFVCQSVILSTFLHCPLWNTYGWKRAVGILLKCVLVSFVFTAIECWYLLSNGSDTSTCGRNVSYACSTLDWLLDRFYKSSYKHNHTLSLETDLNLSFDNILLVSLLILYRVEIEHLQVSKSVQNTFEKVEFLRFCQLIG